MEKEPKLTFPDNQTGEFVNYHHRAFAQQLTEPDAEIHSEAPVPALGIKKKRGKTEYMGKGSQDNDGKIYRDSWIKLVETQEL